jgi:hypothetical protein
MRKAIAVILLLVLGISSFGAVINLASAQESTEPVDPTIRVRWIRFRGGVKEWGEEAYHGSLIMNAETVRVPTVWRTQWASVRAVWSNERRPFASETSPVGNFTYTHYTARLRRLTNLKVNSGDLNLNLTGIWDVKKVKITYEFDDDSVLIKTIREVTPIATRARGQLHIMDRWKKFDIQIEGIDTLKGVGLETIITRARINAFSFEAGANANLQDLIQITRCFRAMPGFGNYVPELDYNLDSKIDLADLTTVAANM